MRIGFSCISIATVVVGLAGLRTGQADGPDLAVIDRDPTGAVLGILRWEAPIPWSTARETAIGLGGDLASIDSAKANARLACLRGEPFLDLGECDGPWIGLGRVASALPGGAAWSWADGSAASFAAWGEGRPAGSPRLPGYATMVAGGAWFDALPGPDAGSTVRAAAIRWSRETDKDADGVPDALAASGIPIFVASDGCGGDPADLDGDGRVNGADLAAVLGNWGGSGVGDVNGDGVVNANDLAAILGAWTG